METRQKPAGKGKSGLGKETSLGIEEWTALRVAAFPMFVNQLRAHIEMAGSLAGGGAALMALTFLYVKGYRTDVRITFFRAPGILVIPFLLFALAIVAGYGASNRLHRIGFEIATDTVVEAALDAKVEEACYMKDNVVDPGYYYNCVHDDRMGLFMWAQAFLLGKASLIAAIWFVYNMVSHRRPESPTR